MTAVLTTLVAAALAVATNIATSVESLPWWLAWAKSSGRAWTAVGVLVVVTVVLAVAVVRGGRTDAAGLSTPASASESGQAIGEVSGGNVSGPTHAPGGTVINAPGATFHGLPGALCTAPGPVEPALGVLVVGEIPAEPVHYVARDAAAQLSATLADERHHAVVVCAVAGGRGVGKTHVAAAYARDQVNEGCPLVLWIAADTADRLLAGLAEAAAALGVADPKGDSEKSAISLRRHLEGRRQPALMVVDNAAIEPALLRRFLPAAGPTRAVITSTDRAFRGLGRLVDVSVFTREQSVGYLEVRTGRAAPEEASAVADALGDLPLALAQAASVIESRGWSYEEYLGHLRSHRAEALLPADRGDGYPLAVAESILLALDAARDAEPTGRASQVLDTLALLSPSGVSRGVLDKLMAKVRDGAEPASPGVDLDAVVGRLVDASLLSWAGVDAARTDLEAGGRTVAMHRLVARILRERCEAHGSLIELIAEVAAKLGPLTRRQHWASREQGLRREVVAHCLALWNIARVLPPPAAGAAHVEGAAELAGWAVRHLADSADLSRSVEIGGALVADAEQVLGTHHPATLASRHHLAYAYRAAGRPQRAITLNEATLADRKRVLGVDHPDTLATRQSLALAYKSTGQWQRATLLLEHNLAERERVLGADHPDTLDARNSLANAYRSTGQMNQAITLFEATLNESVRVLGADHPDTLAARNHLADTYLSAGQWNRAVGMFEQNLIDQERVLGPDHPDTLNARDRLATSYGWVGDLERAIPLLEQNLADRRKIRGEHHPDTLAASNNLAYGYELAGDLDRALPLFEQNSAEAERLLGVDHPHTLTARHNIAYGYKSAGQFDRAIPLLEQNLHDRTQLLGADHPDTLLTQINLSVACESAGDLDRAIPLFEATLADSERVLGADHPLTMISRNNLAHGYRSALLSPLT